MSLALPASKLAAGEYSITEDFPWLSYRSFPYVFDLELLKVMRYFPNGTSANTCHVWKLAQVQEDWRICFVQGEGPQV